MGGAFCHKELQLNCKARYDFICSSDQCKILEITDLDYKMAYERVIFKYRMYCAAQLKKIKMF